ncbi:acyclic terpene utilization AtuA family protein [Minwuia thermotolerans]|uniref:ABC transporter substrate-binding protein n=1 Tax=Minwuia thermotolerans TaxID=2056226 RepID=A0A2M9FVP3_9PROT|nr:acyclic terpene utilization AtuA family protein [Minwuia thermotolerans]PJK27530.1 ABC transporter substrate-binding protein [Minwuia thermotolerans]
MTGGAVRIGCGAGFSADRLDGAVDLARDGRLDALVFECVGERTLAFGHRDRRLDPAKGFNPQLEARLKAVWPLCIAGGCTIVTNMGVANPRRAAEVAMALGVDGGRTAAVLGDDVTALIGPETPLDGGRLSVADVDRELFGANAYLGSDALLPALEAGVSLVIGGRIADPALFLSVLRHSFGWAADDWPLLGAGTLVGHLLECGAQVTGGYFADPGHKEVPGLARVGYPLAEVAADGTFELTKLPDAGGMVTAATVREQLLYEVHDPGRYLTPDVTADFSGVHLDDRGGDVVALSGADGTARPETLKVTVAFDGGFLAEGEVSYAGRGAAGRARLAGEVAEERLRRVHGFTEELRLDLIGVQSLHRHHDHGVAPEGTDVRLRVAGRFRERERAEMLLWEVESLLCCGPAGGGGFRGRVTPSVVTHDAFLPRSDVPTRVEVFG